MNFTAGTTGQFYTANSSTPATFQNNITTSIFNTKITLTSAQIKALNITPVQIIPAPGSGKTIFILNFMCKLIYGGNNAFTGSGGIYLIYKASSGAQASSGGASNISTNTQNATAIISPNFFSDHATGTNAQIQNEPLLAYNYGSAFAGNASGDNTVKITVNYMIVQI